MKKNNFGISLVALIITIVVMVIIAAVAIFNGFNTAEKAGLAKFIHEASNFNSALQYDYISRIRYNPEYAGMNNNQIYYVMAKGIKPGTHVVPEPSQIDWGDVQILPYPLEGTEFYEITDDRNIASWDLNKRYGDEDRHYISNKGEGFILPGYAVQTSVGTKWYINEEKYYYTGYTGGIITSGDDNIAPPEEETREDDIITRPIEVESGEYKELYYLQSNGTQYINTGLLQKSDMHLKVRYQIIGKVPVLEGDKRLGVLGFAGGGNDVSLMVGFDQKGHYAFTDYWVKHQYNINQFPVDETIHTMDISSGSIKLDGVEAPIPGVFEGDPYGKNVDKINKNDKNIISASGNKEIYLFAVHAAWGDGKPTYGSNIRIYDATITYDKGTEDPTDDETYYFIPVLETNTNKPGMYKYDSANDTYTFLPKNSGSEFVYREISALPPASVLLKSAGYDLNTKATPLNAKSISYDNGKLSYQWYVSNTLGGNGTKISGATNATYTPPTDQVGIKYYYCEITNTKGKYTASTNSGRAQIIVKEGYEKPTSRTPEGYVELEYVDSNGNWFIDTEVLYKENTKMEVTFASLSSSIGGMGWGERGSNSAFAVGWDNENQNPTVEFHTNYGKYETVYTGHDVDSEKHTAMIENGKQIFDGVENATKPYVAAKDAKTNLFLFGLHCNWQDNQNKTTFKVNTPNNGQQDVAKFGASRLYECKLYEGDVLVRHYIPAKNSNGEAGVYDLVNNKFDAGFGVEVPSGTHFIGGPEI